MHRANVIVVFQTSEFQFVVKELRKEQSKLLGKTKQCSGLALLRRWGGEHILLCIFLENSVSICTLHLILAKRLLLPSPIFVSYYVSLHS